VVSFVHGLQSHSGWFFSTASELARAGFLCLFADRRGAGKNPRRQRDRSSLLALLRDVAEVDGHARRIAGERGLPAGLPVGLIGHSFGGALAILAAARGQLAPDWLWLISPGLSSKGDLRRTPGWYRMFWRWAERSTPRLSQRIMIPPRLLTDSRVGQVFVKRDRLRLLTIDAQFFGFATGLKDLLGQEPGRATCPTLLVLAGEDQLVDNPSTEALCRRLCGGPLTVQTFAGCGHTIELTAARPRLVPALLDFLAATER